MKFTFVNQLFILWDNAHGRKFFEICYQYNEVGDWVNSLSDKIYILHTDKEGPSCILSFFFNKCRPLSPDLSLSLLGISPFCYRSLGVPVSAAMCCCDSFFCRSRNACLFAAAIGQPDRLLCVFRFELTCPRPLHPGVGHFRIVSCKAKTGQDNIIYTHIYIFIY